MISLLQISFTIQIFGMPSRDWGWLGESKTIGSGEKLHNFPFNTNLWNLPSNYRKVHLYIFARGIDHVKIK